MERQSAPQPPLTARWIEVEGKLICQWEPSETPTVPKVVLNWPETAQAA
jgi:hypothetical protein